MADFKPVIAISRWMHASAFCRFISRERTMLFPKARPAQDRDVSARIGRFIDIDELESITRACHAQRLIV